MVASEDDDGKASKFISTQVKSFLEKSATIISQEVWSSENAGYALAVSVALSAWYGIFKFDGYVVLAGGDLSFTLSLCKTEKCYDECTSKINADALNDERSRETGQSVLHISG